LRKGAGIINGLAIEIPVKTGIQESLSWLAAVFAGKEIVDEHDWDSMKHKARIRCKEIHPHIHRTVK